MTFEVDLNEVKVVEPENHSNKVMINDSIGVILNYPSLKISASVASQMDSIENILDLIYEHLDYVFDEESKYEAGSFSKEEFYDFMGALSLDQLEPFKNFFSTMPYVETHKDVKCNKCEFEHKILV
jgi:hypothetical protein